MVFPIQVSDAVPPPPRPTCCLSPLFLSVVFFSRILKPPTQHSVSPLSVFSPVWPFLFCVYFVVLFEFGALMRNVITALLRLLPWTLFLTFWPSPFFLRFSIRMNFPTTHFEPCVAPPTDTTLLLLFPPLDWPPFHSTPRCLWVPFLFPYPPSSRTLFAFPSFFLVSIIAYLTTHYYALPTSNPPYPH